MNEYHIRAIVWASQADVERMQKPTFAVNDVLKKLFAAAGLLPVDYKPAFGNFHGELLLGGEFSPDGCCPCDKETRNKYGHESLPAEPGSRGRLGGSSCRPVCAAGLGRQRPGCRHYPARGFAAPAVQPDRRRRAIFPAG